MYTYIQINREHGGGRAVSGLERSECEGMHTCAHRALTWVRASGRGLRTRDPGATLPHTVRAQACFTQSQCGSAVTMHSPRSQKPSCTSQHRPTVADARPRPWRHWHGDASASPILPYRHRARIECIGWEVRGGPPTMRSVLVLWLGAIAASSLGPSPPAHAYHAVRACSVPRWCRGWRCVLAMDFALVRGRGLERRFAD